MSTEMNEELSGCHKVFAGYRGSLVYGLHDGDSDYDKFEVFVAPKSHYIGLSEVSITGQKLVGNLDVSTMELRHFCKLVRKQSPTILEWLYTPSYYLNTSLRPISRVYLSKKLYKPFIGFASSIANTPKQLSHKVRLLTMCKEALLTGELIVDRPDKDYLMSIKSGEYKPDVDTLIPKLLSECERALEVSRLPEDINIGLLQMECEETILAHW